MTGRPAGRDDAEGAGRADPDLPPGIAYDSDLAVHEPARAGDPATPGRRRSPLLLFAFGIAALAALVYLLFGLIAEEGRTPADVVNTLRGRRGAWQEALDLSRLLAREDRAGRDPRLVPDILALFDEARGDEPRVRRYLALALGEARDPRALEALADAARADADPETRIFAAWGLGAIGDRRGAAGLLPLLDAEDPGLRKVAVYALGSLPLDPGTAGPVRRLLHDPVEDVAWNAALALARQDDAAGLSLLLRMIDRAFLDAIRRADAAGGPRPLGEPQKEEAIIGALAGIARVGDATHLDRLRALSESDPSLRVRQAAFEAIAAIERDAP
jgi:HEAT repeat protein